MSNRKLLLVACVSSGEASRSAAKLHSTNCCELACEPEMAGGDAVTQTPACQALR